LSRKSFSILEVTEGGVSKLEGAGCENMPDTSQILILTPWDRKWFPAISHLITKGAFSAVSISHM
jgi:hypothetical protein